VTLAERLESHRPPSRTSTLERVLAELEARSPKDAEALRAALADVERVSSQALSDILRAEGFDVGPHPIKAYRRKHGIRQ
jgi:hypothetical protein